MIDTSLKTTNHTVSHDNYSFNAIPLFFAYLLKHRTLKEILQNNVTYLNIEG